MMTLIQVLPVLLEFPEKVWKMEKTFFSTQTDFGLSLFWKELGISETEKTFWLKNKNKIYE